MSTPLRIGAFVAALAVLFGAAFGIGRLFDDEGSAYRLTASYEPGLLSLTIRDGERVVLDYDVRHEKELHLIAVRQDFGDYRHLHPQFAGSAGWIVPELSLSSGVWRLYADFKPTGGQPTVLHEDVRVAGAVAAPAVEQPYQVKLGGDLTSGSGGSMLTFTVTRHGEPVTLQPYLGAFGHLVVLREDDLEYLHVHPARSAATEPVPFHVEVPTGGRYRLYLDYQVDGVVHTATFTLDAAEGDTGDMGDTDGMDHGDH